MNKLLKSSAFIAALTLAASAQAGIYFNGIDSTNGIGTQNALNVNGLKTRNALNVNGLDTQNGIALNGLDGVNGLDGANGITKNGLDGMNGIKANGIKTNGLPDPLDDARTKPLSRNPLSSLSAQALAK